jgi:predicted transcriptional regulator
MKNDHLTLRLPRELARALARWARERGVPKSQLAREAVARYLAPADGAPAAAARIVTAAELGARWALLPRLTPDEATDLATDVEAARRSLPDPPAPWG